MQAERILASLGIKSQQYTVSSPSHDALTQADMVRALTALSKKECALILAKYQSNPKDRVKLSEMVRGSMILNLPKKAHTEDLTNYLLHDIISPKKCRTCKGVGELIVDKKVVTCKTCDGSPNVTTPMVKLGKAIGIARQNWKKTYHDKYRSIIMHYEAVEQRAIAKMKAKFYN